MIGALFFTQHVTLTFTFTNSKAYSQTHVCLLDFKLRTVVFKIWRKYYILRETRDYILVIFLQLMGFFRFYTVMFLEQLNINITAHFILIHLLVSSHFTLLIWTYIFRVPFWNSLYFTVESLYFPVESLYFTDFWHWTVKYNYILLLYFTVERNQFKNLSPSPYTAISGGQSN